MTTMDPGSVYAPLTAEAFASAGIERKSLADDFLNQFLATKVDSNKKKEIDDNLNSYSPFNSAENKIFKRKLFNSKSKKLTAKEKRASKIYDIPKRQIFSDFFTLHLLWEKYMIQLLDIDGAEANLAESTTKKKDEETRPIVTTNGSGLSDHHEKTWLKQLQSADFHGALVTVIKSTNSSLVDKSGIVIAETLNTFKIATPKNVVIVVPKENCVFVFQIKEFVFTIYGNNLRKRSAARSGKQFKFKGTNPLMILDF